MNGVYEVTLPGAARFPDDPPPVEWALHVSTAKLPRAADRWDAPNGVAVSVPVGDVVTLPESDDQQAVTVRMCYPPRRECRSGRWPVGPVPQSLMDELESVDRTARVLPSSPDWASEVRELRAWKESAMSVLAEWDQVWEALGKPGRLGDSIAVASKRAVERLRGLIRDGAGPHVSGSAGDTPNSGEKAGTASGFVTGSCPDRPVNPKIANLFLNAWGNMCGGDE